MGKIKPTKDMELGRHARKAVRAIQDRGHTVRTAEDEAGRVCLIGAVLKVTAPMGTVRSNKLMHEFNERFGQWITQQYPATQESTQLVREFAAGGFGDPPATVWNDRILLHQEEACAWLGKFADAMDPRRL